MIEHENKLPTVRWRRILNGHWPSELEPQEEPVVALNDDLDHLHNMIESAKAECTESEDLTILLNDVSDKITRYGIKVGERAYDAGYGDGWTVGVTAALRIILGANGVALPRTSTALSYLLGLPLRKPIPESEE